MTQRPDPISLQARLATLLDQTNQNERLRGELARARREFFGADQPVYAGDDDGQEAAAVRLAEWFLLERESDMLGETPIAHFGRGIQGDEDLDALRGSRVGLFLAETSGREPQVRDLEGGDRLALTELPIDMSPGDLLVGRIYPVNIEQHVPSAVLTVLPGAAQLAVAFRKDIRALGLDRRLSQAEVEQIVFRQRAAAAQQPELDEVPLERIEAELQTLLAAHGAEQATQVAEISALLAESDSPGPVMGPLMDQLAFDTDVDLDQVRELCVRIWNARHVEGEAPAASPAAASATGKPPQKDFEPRPGESLGEQLARRIEEGLTSSEDIEAMFADVERLMGETIEDEDDSEEPMVDPEVGDLAPLLREFAWETELPEREQRLLESFVAQQRTAPVQRLSIEYVEPDDYLRYLLGIWLDSPPTRRPEALRAAFDLLARFVDWLSDTQMVDLRDRLQSSRDDLLAEVDRLQRASLALSSSHEPGDGDPSRFTLMRVLARSGELCDLLLPDRGQELRLQLDPEVVDELRDGDMLFGAIDDSGDSPRLVGMTVVLPAAAENLLG